MVETNEIYSEDPQFVDTSGSDYRIGRDSPASGAGLAPSLTDGDIAGVCYRTPPSIGAYEIPGGVPIPPIIYLPLLTPQN